MKSVYQQLITLSLGSCLTLAACGSEVKTSSPEFQTSQLNQAASLNAYLLKAEKEQKTEAKLLLCENKDQWRVLNLDDKSAKPKDSERCVELFCSLVSNRIAGEAPRGKSGWLCNGASAETDGIGGGTPGAIPGQIGGSVPSAPPKPIEEPGQLGSIKPSAPSKPTNPIAPAPVPANCYTITDARACFGSGPLFCSAKTTSGKTLTVSGNESSCQNHLEAELEEKACLANETLVRTTLLCGGAPR
jgi:hypothetical protein